jgi:hypothetical protein
MKGAHRLSWLLDPDNPSSRFLTLTGLLGRAASDQAVLAARQAIRHWPPVRALLDAQWPAGYWVGPGVGHSPKYKATIWQVVFLAALGAPRIEAIDRACAYVLDHARLQDGRFSAYAETPTAPGHAAQGATACLNGSLLRALSQLEYQDPRIGASQEALAHMVLGESFRCCFNVAGSPPAKMAGGQPCIWGATKALGALATVPRAQRSPTMQQAIAAGVEFLLGTGQIDPDARRLADGDYPLAGACNRAWHSFGFPPDDTSDLLEALQVLGALGLGGEPQLETAVAVVRHKQDRAGRWRLDHTPANTWTQFGAIEEPNKWITLRATQVLARWDRREERTDEHSHSV